MRRLWRRIPLRIQLALLVAVLLGVLLTSFSGALYVGVRAYLLWQSEQQLRLEAEQGIVALLPTARPATGQRAIPNQAERTQLKSLADYLVDARTSAVVWSVNGNGKELARGRPQPNGTQQRTGPQPPSPPPGSLVRVANRDQAQRYVGLNRNNVPQLAVLMPLRNQQGDVMAALQLATPTRPISTLLARLARYLIAGTMVTMIIGAVLGAWLSARVLRPLGKLVRASDRVAHGDWTTRLNLPPGNELGQVGQAFDAMVARTAETFSAQGRFLADAAHELRTPLTVIGGSIELLQMGTLDHDPAKRRHMLQSAGNELDRMGRLINNLLLLHTLDQHPSTTFAPVDLRLVLDDLAQQIAVIAPDHRLQTSLPQPLPVLGDADQLTQVFLNLLTNAYTYTPPGGTISVTATLDQGVCIAVSDTGIGIPPEDLPRVQERLYRVDRSRSRAKGGFGLGLAIVQSIVSAHNGRITITSTLNQGTTIKVWLPAPQLEPIMPTRSLAKL